MKRRDYSLSAWAGEAASEPKRVVLVYDLGRTEKERPSPNCDMSILSKVWSNGRISRDCSGSGKYEIFSTNVDSWAMSSSASSPQLEQSSVRSPANIYASSASNCTGYSGMGFPSLRKSAMSSERSRSSSSGELPIPKIRKLSSASSALSLM